MNLASRPLALLQNDRDSSVLCIVSPDLDFDEILNAPVLLIFRLDQIFEELGGHVPDKGQNLARSLVARRAVNEIRIANVFLSLPH